MTKSYAYELLNHLIITKRGILTMSNSDWMKDERLSNISQEKLEFLKKIFVQGSKLTQKEMMPYLLSLSKLSRENNISFSKDEMKLIYSVLQKYSTPEDNEKMRRLSSYFQ